jgi:hypothetical protein
MSLLEKASIITTPTAYGVGVLNSIKPAIPVGDGDFDFARTSTATRVNEDYLIETVAANIPRLDYTNGVAQILVEPESTNLVTYSEDFSQWSIVNNVVVTDNFTISPDGTQNASKLVFDGTASGRIELSVTASGTNTQSVYLKTESGTQNVSIGADAADTTEFTITDKWVRYTHTGTGSSPRILCNDVATIYVYGAQLEDLSYATSYIPTSGSSVTRATETLNNAGNSDLFNNTAGTLYCEIAALNNDGVRRDISFSNGNTSNVVRISFHSVSNTIRAQIRAGNVVVASLSYVVPDAKDFYKVALSFDANRARLFVDGVEVGLDTSVTTPSGLNTLDFNAGGTSGPFYGKCKTVAVFKEALSESEMACLTSTGNREIFLNYYYRMHYVGANIDALSCAEKTFNV